MKKSLCFLLFYLLLSRSVFARDPAGIREAIDSIAGEHLKNTDGIGFVIAVYNSGQKEFYSYGINDPGTRDRADSGTVFEIGPVSETFTAIAFAQLAIKGAVGIDDPLQNYLPVDVPAPVYQKIVCAPMKDAENPYGIGQEAGKKFTPYVCLPDASEKPQPILLCYLATHTSGLPAYPHDLKSPKGKDDPYAGYSKRDLYEFLKNYRLLEPIGYDYLHSALGISILGHVLSLREKKPFERVVEENLLEPLGMNQTKIKLQDPLLYRFVNGYNRTGKKQAHWNYDILAPSGGYHSTPADMMRFLEANISSGKSSMTGVLDFTHNPRIRLSESKKGIEEIALGWRISPLGIEQQKIVWQGGVTAGFASYIGFVETSHTGVVILSNCSVPLDEMGEQVLRVMNR
ncbi:MAG TPA: serine hydrolase domain-containing protein [Bacteroidia bacterium]|nr:serine hydrolase domain-containing protein [Bacteroidia bacterium]